MKKCVKEAYDIYSAVKTSDSVFITEGAEVTQFTDLEIEYTRTLFIYPLDLQFAILIQSLDFLLTQQSVMDSENVAPFYYDTNSVIKLVIICLPGYQKLLLQTSINGEWFTVYEKEFSCEGKIRLKILGTALVSDEEPEWLSSYPQFSGKVPGRASKRFETVLLTSELVTNMFLAGDSMLSVSYQQLKHELEDRVLILQDILLSGIDVQQFVEFLSYMEKILHVKPFFKIAMKYAVSSNAQLSQLLT